MHFFWLSKKLFFLFLCTELRIYIFIYILLLHTYYFIVKICNKTTNMHTHILESVYRRLYLACALQTAINNKALWLFGRLAFAKGLKATHHSLLTRGSLKVDVFKVLGRGDFKEARVLQTWARLGETLLDPPLKIL